MYSVVGCSECEALWIVEDRPETTSCPRCRTRHQFDRLKRFVTTDEKDEAREVRAAMLADRQDRAAAYEDLDSVEDMEALLDEIGIEDGDYLQEKGVDPDEAEAAGEAATAPRSRKSRRERVLDAIRSLDQPTESAVVTEAEDRGVPAAYTRKLLEKLARNGDVTRTGNGYRLL